VSEGLFRMTEVIVSVTAETDDFEAALDDSRARQDDAWWARHVRLPYTPQRFISWWVARRWIIPRDIRRS
jgi:hypothetical protein